jgi:hypothetical protein
MKMSEKGLASPGARTGAGRGPDPAFSSLIRAIRVIRGWFSSSGWGRGELLAVGLFCLVCVAVPLFCVELYPFSRAPMFTGAPRLYCTYNVLDPQGRPLPAEDFGLQRNYWGNPLGVGVGFHPPPSADRFGEVVPRAEVSAAVRRRLADRPGLRYVEVVRAVIGPVDERRVGVVRRERWRVTNPSSPPEAP